MKNQIIKLTFDIFVPNSNALKIDEINKFRDKLKSILGTDEIYRNISFTCGISDKSYKNQLEKFKNKFQGKLDGD